MILAKLLVFCIMYVFNPFLLRSNFSNSMFRLSYTKCNSIAKKNNFHISLSPIATIFEQTSTFQSKSAYNHPKIAFKCRINSRPYTRFTGINSYLPSALVSTSDRKCKPSNILRSSTDGLFAYVIISTMTFMPVIIILTDVSKYGFNIGSLRKRHQRSKQKYRTNYSKECQPTIIRRSRILINISKLQTISEEDEF